MDRINFRGESVLVGRRSLLSQYLRQHCVHVTLIMHTAATSLVIVLRCNRLDSQINAFIIG